MINDNENDILAKQGGQATPDRVAKLAQAEGTAAEIGGTTAEVGGAALQATGASVQIASKLTKYGSEAVDAGGKVATKVGGGLIKAGGELSGTGLGAIAGVPMMIAGGIVTGAGYGARGVGKAGKTVGQVGDKGGRLITRTGRKTKETGKNIKSVGRNVRKFGKLPGMGKGKAGASSEPELKNTDIALLMGVAIFVDLLQFAVGFIPFVGWILNAIMGVPIWLMFYMLLKSKGINLISTKKILGIVGAFGVKEIPYLNLLPAWTFFIFKMTAKDKLAKVSPQAAAVLNKALSK